MRVCFPTLLFAVLCSTFCAASIGEAQITVDRAIVTFKAGERPVRNVLVQNGGGEPFFIEVVTDVMVDPGTPDEQRVTTTKLVASPKRFELAAGAERTVRLLGAEPPGEIEQVYRLKFLPQPKPFEEDASKKKSAGRSAEVKVLFTIGMLIFVEPAQPKVDLSWEKTLEGLTFTNNGNVNVFLEEGQHCAAPDTDCKKLPAQRLYPGNTWKVAVPAGRVVTFRKQAREEYEQVVIP